MNSKLLTNIEFPGFRGARCLMMPFVQGEPDSLPVPFRGYDDIIASLYFKHGDIGYLTIDESYVKAGTPHRGARAKYGRALHTEAGVIPGTKVYKWGRGGNWGGSPNVTLDPDVQILLANSIDDTCAVWDAEHKHTSDDGDIGDWAEYYPYDKALMLKAGEVVNIGIFTPHESVPVKQSQCRQFIRIISSGVHGREPYFTENPILPWEEVTGQN